MDDSVRGRFAPSPSGRLHLGNLTSSLLAWLDVRSRGGVMVFRLEDLDPQRSWDEYAKLMAEDLRWLGLDWDEGWPESPDYAQGRRTALYENAFGALRDAGLIYPCFCSRSQRLAASAPHPGEDRGDGGCACRHLTPSEITRMTAKRPPAYKIIVPHMTVSVSDGHYGEFSEELTAAGDFILRRSDGVFAYQLAVSVDDAAMGITRVVRARDLLDSSPRQKWLIELLGGKAPGYCHAPLLISTEGRKLSKREGDLNMEALHALYTPRQLCGRLAFLCGLIDRPEPVSPSELVSGFSWDKVPKEDIPIPDDLF